ncbi:ferrous iron transport protein A [Aestuariicella hydrocarbonica]|uniref:Ferrous iron transport protein A n=1 Tax=Pseudomaricurvus hydrocarbonicus TaxID=1470433 RepID=A0A9E5JUA2_9GAMM|nr:FeoA family protein [Aestuariicella hydrocarbonica]NHO65434.1 ferrous iron transport protein A [Aestuariicella hydrocarbonica]
MTSITSVSGSDDNALQSSFRTLDQCNKGECLRLQDLVAQPAFGEHDEEVTLRLKELGFLPGTTMTVLGYGFLGRDPISVKVSGTKFALRRTEASKLVVTTLEAQA